VKLVSSETPSLKVPGTHLRIAVASYVRVAGILAILIEDADSKATGTHYKTVPHDTISPREMVNSACAPIKMMAGYA
jgi:hypothetical protein